MIPFTSSTQILTPVTAYSPTTFTRRTPHTHPTTPIAPTAHLVYSTAIAQPPMGQPNPQLPLRYHIWDITLNNTPPEPLPIIPNELCTHSHFFRTDTNEPAPVQVYQLDFSTKTTSHTEKTQASSYITCKYKPVAKWTKPVPTTLPEQFCIQCQPIPNALDNTPVLLMHPSDFRPGKWYTHKWKATNNQNLTGFLWPEEEKLAHKLIRLQEDALAWVELEKGSFSPKYFDPIVFPVVEHIPWQFRNIPILPGKYDEHQETSFKMIINDNSGQWLSFWSRFPDEIISIIKDKIVTGIYKLSNSSYRLRWFCVFKKDGKSLQIVHDLQPLNTVSIQDRGVPPISKPYAESFGSQACYGVFDLFVSFDQCVLDLSSWDMTMFQTPLGTYQLTQIPMGYTNLVQIMQGDVMNILQDKIPAYTIPFINDILVKGLPSWYQYDNGIYETIPSNPSIWHFVWEHLQIMNWILQCVKKVGGAFNGKKLPVCVPEIDIIRHHCTYDGRVPCTTKTAVM